MRVGVAGVLGAILVTPPLRTAAATDFSSPHQAHGSQAKAPSAPNQSLAPQQMIQPFNAAISATKIDNGKEKVLSRASRNAPAARTKRCVIESAAACCGNVSGNFQMRTT